MDKYGDTSCRLFLPFCYECGKRLQGCSWQGLGIRRNCEFTSKGVPNPSLYFCVADEDEGYDG